MVFYFFILLKKHQICILYQKAFLKKNCVKELHKKSIEKIMWDSTYTQKWIISAFIKALQMKLLPSARTQFTLRSISHIKYITHRKRCYSSRLVFNNLAKLTKISTKKSMQQVLFHFNRSAGSIKVFSLYKKPQAI